MARFFDTPGRWRPSDRECGCDCDPVRSPAHDAVPNRTAMARLNALGAKMAGIEPEPSLGAKSRHFEDRGITAIISDATVPHMNRLAALNLFARRAWGIA
jgi:hypothetical protein